MCCNLLKLNVLQEWCDTCDSKNDKTRCNAGVRVRARRMIIDIFTTQILHLQTFVPKSCFLISDGSEVSSNHSSKTTRCFVENDTLFYEK